MGSNELYAPPPDFRTLSIYAIFGHFSFVTTYNCLFIQMIFLPECFDYVATSTDESVAMAESIDGEVVSSYCELARRYKLWFSLGGMHLKVFFCCLVRLIG